MTEARLPRSIMARVRHRIRREIARAEGDEPGELSLVPYLDVVVNTIVFLLATSASVVPLAQISVGAPREAPVDQRDDGSRTQRSGPSTPELHFVVAVGYRGFIVADAGRVARASDDALPTLKCRLPLERGRCPAQNNRGDGYDYLGLAALAREIKERHPDERRVTLMADREVPYRVVVRTMDTLRGRSSDRCRAAEGCLFDRVVLATGVR